MEGSVKYQYATRIPGPYQRIEKVVEHADDSDTDHIQSPWNSLREQGKTVVELEMRGWIKTI